MSTVTAADRYPRSPRDLLVDLGCIGAALFVALAAADDAQRTGRLTGDGLFWALLLAVAGCLALWWRRRFPIATALALAPTLLISDLAGGAVLVATYTVAAERGWRWLVAVVSLFAAAPVRYSVARPDPDFTVLAANALNVALLLVVAAVGWAVRRRRAALAAAQRHAALAALEAGVHADRLRELERERIAREMHDLLTHRISLISLHAGALEIRTDLSPEEVGRTAGIIRTSAHQALEDLREILGMLRAQELALRPQPGLADLDALVTECRAAGTPVVVDGPALDDASGVSSMPPAVSRAAYRVVQEGLTNARKHAPGAEVHLRLDRGCPDELHIWLRNPLVTAVPGVRLPGGRSGLVGLAERVSLAGGRLDHGVRRAASGEIAFHVEAWLPWPR